MSASATRSPSTVRFLFVFAGAFVLLYGAWSAARDTPVGRLVVDVLTVAPADWVVNRPDPAAAAHADGHRIRSPGQTLSVLNGCECTEVMLLLAAAFAASGLRWRWRWRLGGLAAGLALAWGKHGTPPADGLGSGGNRAQRGGEE